MTHKIIRLQGVMGCTGQSRSNLYLHVKQGLFPKPVKLGLRASGWPEAEIEAINQARISGRTHDEIRVLVKELERDRFERQEPWPQERGSQNAQ
jgi:prophage regulatory protein